ncbi:uncharacterized protein LOC108596595 isoform X2 [Drosophila busckii]|uniref:uncharacterized protein LOC108596595 isoform X2 n=1 Tax=Drosophila busckii TaxID=30019 RepID=UPI00083F4C14|nr:uncharacterized protein LOC108596595 isoform X2 [Drosophila busckii]
MDTSKRPWSGRRERKKFCLITYLLFAAFLILACAQWYLFYLVDATKLFFKDYYWVGIIFFLIAWVLVIIFIYVEELRFIVPINWIMGILIYEFIVLSLSSLAVKQYQYHLGVSFVIWAIVLALFILLGTLIPLAPKWSDDCNEHWNGTHPLVVDKYVSDTSTTTEDIEDSTTTTPDILANTTYQILK